MPVKLTPLDAFLSKGKLQEQMTVFYKSTYHHSCFAVLTASVDKVGDAVSTPNVKFKSYNLDGDDLFLRVKVGTSNINGNDLYRHNSLYH